MLSIKRLNDEGYVHGDIKPDNFIYNNPKNYYLIDFNASDEINKENNNKKMGTFPYIPPEKNRFTDFHNKFSNVKSDLWSVGIILLQFISKNKNIFLKNGKNCEESSLFQYSKLYGSDKSKIQKYKKIQFNGQLDFFQPDFIIFNYHREEEEEKVNIINLIKNLLEIDANKRITVAQALNNDFFKNEIDDYYCKYCLNKISNEELSNKYDLIDKFKICVICNKIIENEKIKNCEICKNVLHISCSKKDNVHAK